MCFICVVHIYIMSYNIFSLSYSVPVPLISSMYVVGMRLYGHLTLIEPYICREVKISKPAHKDCMPLSFVQCCKQSDNSCMRLTSLEIVGWNTSCTCSARGDLCSCVSCVPPLQVDSLGGGEFEQGNYLIPFYSGNLFHQISTTQMYMCSKNSPYKANTPPKKHAAGPGVKPPTHYQPGRVEYNSDRYII